MRMRKSLKGSYPRLLWKSLERKHHFNINVALSLLFFKDNQFYRFREYWRGGMK